jgi:hypothetical protein
MVVSAESEHAVQDKHLPLVVSVSIADLMKSLLLLEAPTDMSVRDKYAQMSHTDLLDQLVDPIHIVNLSLAVIQDKFSEMESAQLAQPTMSQIVQVQSVNLLFALMVSSSILTDLVRDAHLSLTPAQIRDHVLQELVVKDPSF